ncbi:hypothetical protein NQ315_002372 [Exocentrus adspersus]|uniref:FLYWCH-type domain-containing protein n=1 Tax=Exocentrus adspersus TaxID=1586481 RepID=A0AAV8VTC2_9CUCU|nr:hypothetical protein NQ315_002372 [Exocentrus adspersus]
MDQIEYVKSNKGGVKIIYKGYMYTVHKNKKCGGVRWRCAQRSFNCKGSISTNAAGSVLVNMPHNHLPDYQSLATARHKFEDNSDRFVSNFTASEAIIGTPRVVSWVMCGAVPSF